MTWTLLHITVVSLVVDLFPKGNATMHDYFAQIVLQEKHRNIYIHTYTFSTQMHPTFVQHQDQDIRHIGPHPTQSFYKLLRKLN